ncbi:PRC-barrel domain-containing protein [Novosphingobium sp. Gsoil 351]|uniref:PRC-barrel domain-containing protein n=1 Tax=Novosphingobium sp. Gsoil 351 TaxID=2675225 RepID=UPI0012B4D9CF|nr:PRC-barrel domain-containing protein [Novosphingobium sp. Gsoil 351]QGN55725.1 PRC-barrel domain containing protein [Novosphingobium sp. Gsoil 351]
MVDTASEKLSPANAAKLILASRIEEAPVYNKAGERIGHIADLSIDRVSGEVAFAIMSFGGFLGIGRRFHPLPWSLLHFDVERDGYVVPVERQALVDAPHYDADELRALGGPSYKVHYQEVVGYYGILGGPII